MSARADRTAVIVASLEGGQMRSVLRFAAHEFDTAVAAVRSLVDAGREVRVTYLSLANGALAPEQRARLDQEVER